MDDKGVDNHPRQLECKSASAAEVSDDQDVYVTKKLKTAQTVVLSLLLVWSGLSFFFRAWWFIFVFPLFTVAACKFKFLRLIVTAFVAFLCDLISLGVSWKERATGFIVFMFVVIILECAAILLGAKIVRGHNDSNTFYTLLRSLNNDEKTR